MSSNLSGSPPSSPRWDDSPISSFEDLTRRVNTQLESNGDATFVVSLLDHYCKTCVHHKSTLNALQAERVDNWSQKALKKGYVSLSNKILKWKVEHQTPPLKGVGR